jgi:hypothetical protein
MPLRIMGSTCGTHTHRERERACVSARECVREIYTKTDTPRHVPRPMCNISHVLAVADKHRSSTRAHAHTHTPHARRACKEVILGACLAHSSVSSIQSWWLVLPLRDTNLHRQTTHTHTQRERVRVCGHRQRERKRQGRGRQRETCIHKSVHTPPYKAPTSVTKDRSKKHVCRCMCLCAYVPVCLCACVPMCLCAYVPVCLCAYVPMCLCACVPVCLCAYVPVCLCAYVPMCLCACVPMCLCACVCVNILVIIDGLGNAAGSLVPAARLSQIVCIFLHPVRLQLRPRIVAHSSAP